MKTKLLPYIKAFSTNRDLYYIDLFYVEDTEEQVPKITFVAEDNQPIANPDDIGITGSELVKSSFKNLTDIDFSLDSQEFDNGRILSKVNYEFASEKILDKVFLRKAAEQLGAKKIRVAIPVRDSILICDASSEENIRLLNRELHRLYNDFSKETLSRLIYEVEDGIILSAEYRTMSYEEIQFSSDSLGSYKCDISKAKLFGELYNVRVTVEAENMEDFQKGVFGTIQTVINEHLNEKHFNKTIELLSCSNYPEKNNENIVKIKGFFHKIKESIYLKEISLHVKNPIKVTFMFSEDFRSGNNHEKITFLLN